MSWVRVPLSALFGLLVTVAMLWAITRLTHPPARPPAVPAAQALQLRAAAGPVAVAPGPPLDDSAPDTPPQLASAALSAPPAMPPRDPLPATPAPAPAPASATLPPATPPAPAVRELPALDLSGEPLLGKRPSRRRPTTRIAATPKPATSESGNHRAGTAAGAAGRLPAQPTGLATTATDSGGERRLTPLFTPAPRYPRQARRRHQQGAVKLRFAVDPDGSVADIEVVWSRPPGVFDRAARQALSRWRFEPGRAGDGRAIRSHVSQVIRFELGR